MLLLSWGQYARIRSMTEDIIKKATEVVHIGNRLSLVERKVWNTLLHRAYTDLMKKSTHSITVRDLCRSCSFTTNNLDSLKDALRGLRKTEIEWVALGGVNEKSETWTNIGFLSGVRIRRGRVEYSFDPFLRELLYHPRVFVLFMMKMQNQFRGSYALALYETCKRFERVKSTGYIPTDTWREILGVKGVAYYEDFRRFRSKLLTPAITEVNAVSDIKIKAEYRRENRRVVAIRFSVSPNPQIPLFTVEGSRNGPEDGTEEEFSKVIEGLSKQEIEDLEASFERDEVSSNAFIRERFALHGYKNPAIRALWMTYVVKQTQERTLNDNQEGR